MKIAVVGSRNITQDIPEKCIPENVSEIFSGGARGIDAAARRYAKKHRILITDILPEYDLYGRRAPLLRNDVILRQVDMVCIFWDGKSHGTDYILKKCQKENKPYMLYVLKGDDFILKEKNRDNEI